MAKSLVGLTKKEREIQITTTRNQREDVTTHITEMKKIIRK